jgi:chorismate mutase/prephenate dehydratase
MDFTMTVDEIRAGIDEIDEQLAALFAKRMRLSMDVAATKLQSNDPIYKPEREEQILNKIESMLPEEIKWKGRSLFTSLILLSRELQYQYLAEKGKEVVCISKFRKDNILENKVKKAPN